MNLFGAFSFFLDLPEDSYQRIRYLLALDYNCLWLLRPSFAKGMADGPPWNLCFLLIRWLVEL